MTTHHAPPHDPEAEASVVASILVDEGAMTKVALIVRAADFHNAAHRWTFEACETLTAKGEDVNQITVAHELEKRGRLEEAGGLTYLSDLITNLPTPVGVEGWAQIVASAAFSRRIIQAGTKIVQLGYEADDDTALPKAEALLRELHAGTQAGGFVRLSEYLDTFLEPPEPGAHSTRGGDIKTGLPSLDGILEALGKSDLDIVAARTGVGKTALMLDLARRAAVNQGARVAVFSLEMSGEQVAQRILAAQSGVDQRRVRLGVANEDEERLVMHAHGVLSQADVYVDDSATLDVATMASKLRRLSQDGPLDLVVVDYLQLMRGSRGRNDNRVQEVSDITRALKQLARELDVPIVAGSQLSREPDKRADHRPQLSDLRESGSIEQDADVVLFIYREETHTTREDWAITHPDHLAEPYPAGLADLIVAKNRHGPPGTVTVRFRDKLSRFEDIDEPEAVRLL